MGAEQSAGYHGSEKSNGENFSLIEQSTPTVASYRRTDQQFIPAGCEQIDAVVPLSEVGVDLPLTEIYQGTNFPPDAVESDEGNTQR